MYINNADAIPDNIVDKTTDQGSPIPILFNKDSNATPDIAITLPPINLIIASPFCAGDIAFAFLPNRICTEPTSIFTPSFRIFRTCFNIPTNKLIIPSINEDTKPLTKSNILSPKNAFA